MYLLQSSRPFAVAINTFWIKCLSNVKSICLCVHQHLSACQKCICLLVFQHPIWALFVFLLVVWNCFKIQFISGNNTSLNLRNTRDYFCCLLPALYTITKPRDYTECIRSLFSDLYWENWDQSGISGLMNSSHCLSKIIQTGDAQVTIEACLQNPSILFV